MQIHNKWLHNTKWHIILGIINCNKKQMSLCL